VEIEWKEEGVVLRDRDTEAKGAEETVVGGLYPYPDLPDRETHVEDHSQNGSGLRRRHFHLG
jgi:hypothetical protein